MTANRYGFLLQGTGTDENIPKLTVAHKTVDVIEINELYALKG